VEQNGVNKSFFLAVLTFKTDSAKDRYFKAKHMEGVPLMLLSSMPKPPSVSVGSSSSPHNPKHSAKAFSLIENHTASYKEARSSWWKPESVDLKKGGVFVFLESFWINGSIHPRGVAELALQLRAAGVLTSSLYGFKKDKLAKLDSTKWLPLKDFIKSQYDKLLSEKDEQQRCANYLVASTYEEIFSSDHKGLLPSSSKAWKLLDLLETTRGIKNAKAYDILRDQRDFSCRPWIDIPNYLPSPTVDFAVEEQNLKKTYPLLDKISKIELRTESKVEFKPIAEYIRLMGK
jgi:hypothetical protein